MKLCMNEAMYCLVAAGFSGQDVIIGGAVGMAESKLDTLAIGRVAVAGTENEDLGVWQISTKWHADKLQKHPNWRDPYVNAQLAREVWLGRQTTGQDPWAAWNTYKPELGAASPHAAFLALATKASQKLWMPQGWLRVQVG